ncbi:unnamed protein product, partial [Polarella glacialis]
ADRSRLLAPRRPGPSRHQVSRGPRAIGGPKTLRSGREGHCRQCSEAIRASLPL